MTEYEELLQKLEEKAAQEKEEKNRQESAVRQKAPAEKAAPGLDIYVGKGVTATEQQVKKERAQGEYKELVKKLEETAFYEKYPTDTPAGYRAAKRERDLMAEFVELNGPTEDIRKIDSEEDYKQAMHTVKLIEQETDKRIPYDYLPKKGKYWGTPNIDKITELEEANSPLSNLFSNYDSNRKSAHNRMQKMIKEADIKDEYIKKELLTHIDQGLQLAYAMGDVFLLPAAGFLEQSFGQEISDEVFEDYGAVKGKDYGRVAKEVKTYGGFGVDLWTMGKVFKAINPFISKWGKGLWVSKKAKNLERLEKSARAVNTPKALEAIVKAKSKALKTPLEKVRQMSKLSAEMTAFGALWGAGEKALDAEFEDIPEYAAKNAAVAAIAGPVFIGSAKVLASGATKAVKGVHSSFKKLAPETYQSTKRLIKNLNKPKVTYEQAKQNAVHFNEVSVEYGKTYNAFAKASKKQKLKPTEKINIAKAMMARREGPKSLSYSKYVEKIEKNPKEVEGIIDTLSEGANPNIVRNTLRTFLEKGQLDPIKVGRKVDKNFKKTTSNAKKWVDSFLLEELEKRGVNLSDVNFAPLSKSYVGRKLMGFVRNNTETLSILDDALGTNTSAAPFEYVQALGRKEAIYQALAEDGRALIRETAPWIRRDIKKLTMKLKDPKLTAEVRKKIEQKIYSLQGQSRSLQEIYKNADGYAVPNLIKEAEGLGFTGKQGSKRLFQYLHYIDSSPQKVRFATESLKIPGKYDIPAFGDTGLPTPDVAQKQFLAKIRRLLDLTQTQVGEGYLPRYVPYNLQKGLGGKKMSKLASMRIGAAVPRRGGGKPIPGQELNFWNLLETHLGEASSARTVAPVVEKYTAFTSTLRNVGKNQWADILNNTTKQALGQSSDEMEQYLLKRWIKKGEQHLEGQLSELRTKVQPQVWDKIWSNARDLMAHSIFGTRIRLNVLQRMQPELVASVELDPLVIQQAKRMFTYSKTGKKVLKKEYKHLENVLRGVENTALGKTFSLQEKVGTKVKIHPLTKVARAAGVPLKEDFTRGDLFNRQVVHLAGLLHFDKNANDVVVKKGQAILPRELSKGLLNSQRIMVENALARNYKKTGALDFDAGRKVYAAIKNLRANYMYHPVDMPNMFSKNARHIVPFTTWSRNMFSRLISDVRAGDTNTLVKRLSYPIAYLNTLRVVTGIDVPAGHPITAALGVASFGTTPLLSQPGEFSWKGPEALWKTLNLVAPPVKMTSQALESIEKVKKGEDPIRPWGVSKQSFEERMDPKNIESFLTY